MKSLLKLALVPAISGAVLLAGCTSAEVEANVAEACQALGSGLTAVGIVSALVPGGAAVTSTVSQLIADASSQCSPFATAVGNAVASITGLGSTASVTVQAQTASHKLARKFGAPLAVHFTVSPSGSVVLDPASSALLAKFGAHGG